MTTSNVFNDGNQRTAKDIVEKKKERFLFLPSEKAVIGVIFACLAEKDKSNVSQLLRKGESESIQKSCKQRPKKTLFLRSSQKQCRRGQKAS